MHMTSVGTFPASNAGGATSLNSLPLPLNSDSVASNAGGAASLDSTLTPSAVPSLEDLVSQAVSSAWLHLDKQVVDEVACGTHAAKPYARSLAVAAVVLG